MLHKSTFSRGRWTGPPLASRVLVADPVGTSLGAICGTSTVTSYIESNAGVAEGGRTGLANMLTGVLFLLALFFIPVVQTVGGGYPVTAPVMEVHFGHVTGLGVLKPECFKGSGKCINGTRITPVR